MNTESDVTTVTYSKNPVTQERAPPLERCFLIERQGLAWSIVNTLIRKYRCLISRHYHLILTPQPYL